MCVAPPVFIKSIVVKDSFEAISQFRMRGLVCATIEDVCRTYKEYREAKQMSVLGENYFRGHNGQVNLAGPLVVFERKGQNIGEYITVRGRSGWAFGIKIPKQYVGESSSIGLAIFDKIDKTGHSLTFGDYAFKDGASIIASDAAVIPFHIPTREEDCVLRQNDLEKILGRPTEDKFVFRFTAESHADLLRFYYHHSHFVTGYIAHVVTAYNLGNELGNVRVFGKSP